MLKFIHRLQIVLMIVVVAISFFITYDFFITNISFKAEMLLAATIIMVVLALVKLMLRVQFYAFLNKNKTQAEFTEEINPIGKRRLLTYEGLVWFFMLIMTLFQTKLFGITHWLVLSYYFALALDLVFWLIFHQKFQSVYVSGQLMIFTSRPEMVSLRNVKSIVHRYNDFYIYYSNKKSTLLKSDLILERSKQQVNASV